MLTMLALVLMVLVSSTIEADTPPQPRVLKRSRRRCGRTRVATLNCRTLLADERLTELDVTLTENNIMLCALQEVRRNGCLSTTTKNYTIYWFGECSGHGGVGFAVHNKIVHLVKEVRGIPDSNGRLMSMDILLHDTEHPVTIICAYAPPNSKSTQVREKFYSRLRDVVTPKTWLMGDLNARVGRRIADPNFGSQPSETVGPWSLKNDIVPNENGALLLDIATENHLWHVGSHFSCRDSKRWTWRHPRYRSRAVLDHIFVPSAHTRFACRYAVAPAIAVSSDHRLVKFELCFRPRIQKAAKSKQRHLDKLALRNQDIKTAFQTEVSNILGDDDPDLLTSDKLSTSIRSAPITAAEKTLPQLVKTKYPNEFQAETIKLIEQKRTLWKFLQKSGKRVTRSTRDAYRTLCRNCKRAISIDRNRKLELEAVELSKAFAENRFKGYSLLKRQHRVRTKAIMPPERDFTDHYKTHYQLGPEEPIHLAGCDLANSASDETLSHDDFKSGIASLNENRQPGHDDCFPEYVKHGGTKLNQWLFLLMTRIWTFACDLPAIDRVGRLIPIPKKSNSASVDTTRPICLLTTIYKLYAILLFHKVRDRVKEFVSWTQAGFIKGRSCGNNIWIMRRVAERAIEFNVPIYCALVDYKGAFDALNRTTLGRVLGLFLSPNMVRRVLCLYFDARAMVSINDQDGPEFNLLRGVRQGCPASPSFFTVALAYISWTFRLAHQGIRLVNHYLSSLEYADDQIIFTLTANGLQDMLNFIVNTAEPFGLRLSPKKCELICFHRSGAIDKNALPQIKLSGLVLPWKSSVIYLGSCFSEDGKTLPVVKHRICCANTVVERLNNRVFCRRGVNAKLKGHFVDTAVFASLLYGLEHCAFSARDRRCLDGYFLRLAKRILHIRYDYHLSYAEAEAKLDIERPSYRLARERLRWTGHALRSEDVVLQEVLTFIPEGGARRRGRPNLRYYDTLKNDLADRGVVIVARGQDEFWKKLSETAADRVAWRELVKRGR